MVAGSGADLRLQRHALQKSASMFGKYNVSIQKGQASFVRPAGRTAL
jgi:hypothetical protein